MTELQLPETPPYSAQLLGKKRKVCTGTITPEIQKATKEVNTNEAKMSKLPLKKKTKKQGKKGSSKYRGVCWLKERKAWRARIEVNGKREHLGYFNTEEEAALAYDERAKCFRGSITRLNFPNGHKTSTKTETLTKSEKRNVNVFDDLLAYEAQLQKPIFAKQNSIPDVNLYLSILQQNYLAAQLSIFNGNKTLDTNFMLQTQPLLSTPLNLLQNNSHSPKSNNTYN